MERHEIIFRIGDLSEQHCKGCTKRDGIKNQSERQRYCIEKCPVGKELNSLGEQLTEKRKEKLAMKPSYEAYQDYKAQGLKGYQIAEKFGISAASLSQYKRKWKEEREESAPVEEKKESGKVDESQKIIDALKLKNVKLEDENMELKSGMNKLEEINETLEKRNREKFNTIEELKRQLEESQQQSDPNADIQSHLIERQQDMIDKLKAALKVFL